MKKIIPAILATLISISSCGVLADAFVEALDEYDSGSYSGGSYSTARADDVISYIKGVSFKDAKMEAAKLFVSLKNFTSNDMANIAKQFSFDDDKLEFLEYAYEFCSDRGNYSNCVSVLTFSSAKDELYDFIAGNHGYSSRLSSTASTYQVNDIVDYLHGISFDSDRMKAAKLCAKLVKIPADGLVRIASLFSFDDKRLEFLEYAYDYCAYKGNYVANVRRAFNYSSTADKLQSYVNGRR